jgi:hypothetical protein
MSELLTRPPAEADQPANADMQRYDPVTGAAIDVAPGAAVVEQSAADLAQSVVPEQSTGWTEEELRKKLQVQVVDVSSGVISNARDRAEQYINEKTGPNAEGGFFKRMVNKVWTGNLARDAIRNAQTIKARNEIIENGNLYAAQGFDKRYHDNAAEAVTERFISQDRTGDDYAQTHPGESNNEVDDQMGSRIKELVLQYARGDINEEALEEEKKQILSDFGTAAGQEDRNKGLMYADNIIDVAKNAKAAVDHNVGLEDIDKALKSMYGEARMGVRTEAELTKVEKIVEKMAKYGFNETAVGIAANVAIAASAFAVKGAIKAATMGAATGVVAAAWAGARESARVKRDRGVSAREDAESGIVDGKMEDQLYQKRSAKQLSAEISTAYTDMTSDPTSIENALRSVVNARIRIRKSDQENIDLISYSSKVNVEQERAELNYQIAMARFSIDNAIKNANPAEMATAGLEGKSLDQLLDERSNDVIDAIDMDRTIKDEAFQTMRKNQVAKMAAIAFVTGETAALVAQELAAAAVDSHQGLFEGRNPDHSEATVLASFKNWLSGNEAVAKVGPLLSGDTVTEKISDDLSLNMPKGFSLSQDPTSGELTFLGADNQPIGESFALDPAANPAEVLQQKLDAEGYDVQIVSQTVNDNGEQVIQNAPLSPQEYINQHPDEFTHIKRDMWYDNNTKKFDFKELGLQLGGENGTGVDADGNYILRMAGFDEAGNVTHGAASAHLAELQREGKFQLALSMDKSTQPYASMIEFNDKGEAIIQKGSPASQLFEMRDGKLKFEGGYAEASEVREVGPDGRQVIRPIATLSGENSVTGITPATHEQLVVDITSRAAALEDLPTRVPIAAPIYGRTGLRTESYDGAYPEGPDQITPYPAPRPATELARVPGADLAPQPEAPIAPSTDVELYRPDGPNAIEAGPNGGEELPQPPPIRGTVLEQDGQPVGPYGPIDGTPQLEAPAGTAQPGSDPNEVIDGELMPMDTVSAPRNNSADEIFDGEVVPESEASTPGTALDLNSPEAAAGPGTNLRPMRPVYGVQTAIGQRPSGTDVEPYNDNSSEEFIPRIRGAAERIYPERNAIANPRPELESGRFELETSRFGLESSRPALTAAAQTLSQTAGRDFSDPTSFLSSPTRMAIESSGSPEPRSVIRERSAVSSYLEGQRTENPGVYVAVERLANASSSMAGTNRVSVNLIASEDADDSGDFNELRRKLAGYADQRDSNGERLSAGTYEVNVALPVYNGVPANNATSVVQQFIADYKQQNGVEPPINIVAVETRTAEDVAAYSRKVMADATLRRSLNRIDQEKPLYIESQDVDASDVDPQAVSKIMDQLDNKPNVDAVQLEFDKSPEYIVNNDLLLTSQLASRIRDTLTGDRSYERGKPTEAKAPVLNWNSKMVANGWNAAVSADAYARSKGYDPKIETAMKAAKEVGVMLGDDGNEVVFSEVINNYAQDFLKTTGDKMKAEALTSRLLSSLGMRKRDYSLRDGKVDVMEWDGLRNMLDRYRDARKDNNLRTRAA